MEGNPLSLSFFAQSCPSPPPCDVLKHVLSVLAAKAATLSRFNEEYPGYGGFLPWFQIAVANRSQGIAPTGDWENRVPALDNGQMAWGLLAVSTSLTLAGEAALAALYGALFQRMAANALRVFYDSSRGVHRDISRISNMRLPPEQVVYSAEGSGCLCDPYEGELFVFFADLYGNWSGYPRDARDRVWANRRPMLQVRRNSANTPKLFPLKLIMQAAKFTLPDGTALTVQRGFWFSAHEQWKTWTLPYFDVSSRVNGVFWDGEVARTWNSRAACIPGLFASVTNTDPPVCDDGGYISALGIQAIAFQNVTCGRIVTPYAASPMLANPRSRVTGLVWYAHMLNRSRMQGPYGSTESCSVDSDTISPVQTWDSKINSVVAALGGAADIIALKLESDGLLVRFRSVVETEYSRVFPEHGGNASLALPCRSFAATVSA